MEAKSNMLNILRPQSCIEDELSCPSCNVKLKRHQVPEHCEQEIQRLKQMKSKLLLAVKTETENSEEQQHQEVRQPHTVFQRVQRNRQSRLRQRTRKRTATPLLYPCPVCNEDFPHDEIHRHALQCLRRSEAATNGSDAVSSNDEDDTSDYEEYEWAGQKRIRTSSLLHGGYASIGVGQTVTQCNGQQDDDDEDLNVDEDDTHIYGPTQYGEGDVIPPKTETDGSDEESGVTNYVRRLITGSSVNSSATTAAAEVPANIQTGATSSAENCIPKVEPACFAMAIQESASTSKATTPQTRTQHYSQIIESLKAKLRYYENHVQNKFKCLICLDDYRNPTISVSCWHVHCEDCWLRSLGARKLCPQCNLITTPKDLRRIYM